MITEESKKGEKKTACRKSLFATLCVFLNFVISLRHHRTIVSAAFAQSFAPSVQL